MGSGVVTKTQDLLWKERKGYVHIQEREGTEGGGRFPRGNGATARSYLHSWVGAP